MYSRPYSCLNLRLLFLGAIHDLSPLAPLSRRFPCRASRGRQAHQQVFRWKNDCPPSLEQLQTMFPEPDRATTKQNRTASSAPTAAARVGSREANLGSGRARASLPPRAGLGSAVASRLRSSLTTIHETHLPPRAWFLAAHLVATESNRISSLQVQGSSDRLLQDRLTLVAQAA